ncbi:winged helix-turn-helix domain-containing protein [Pleionea mediterranea]|uniref:DNA-binding winged helix-turn-helix (WHTH) protein n=1 Tax=Pleionea mediterranea TaxID=523701 RepID=A0A316G0F8_9GAMM|nr:winged helix-turn-helix domain-containing protein [Pleionea mediterranea]PWK53845.1 DNA-binding winged helix-turn-helix (wHTH) protein [Pleionea mediterranea]
MNKVIDFEGVRHNSEDPPVDKLLSWQNTSQSQRPINNSKVFLIENEWLYNPQEKELSHSNRKSVKLREKTACVLNLLINNKSQIVESSVFFKHVWGGRQVSENVLKQSIKELRSCLKDEKKSLIKTVPKKGYSLHASVCPQNFHSIQPEQLKAQSTTEFLNKESVTLSLSKVSSESNENKERTPIKDKSLHKHGIYQHLICLNYRQWLFSFCFLLIILWAFFSTYRYISTNEQLRISTIKMTEAQSKKNFYQDILIRYHDSPKQTTNTLKVILKKSIGQIDAFKGSNAEKIGMLFALMELYTIAGFYEDSRIIVNRIEKLIVMVYGLHSEEYIQLRFNVIDILIKLNYRQEVLNLSQLTLEQVKKHHSNNSYLLARSYYYSGKSYLYCVAPFCDRSESLIIGEKYTRKALSIFENILNPNDIEIADTLWLLNWFIWDGNEKIKISKKALNIFQSTQGYMHERTASGLEQLGRTLTFWNQDWESGEKMLFKALDIRQNLFPDIHPEMAKIHSYIGEHFFMTGKFEMAIQYLKSAININTASLGEGNDNNLQNIMLMARSQLYSGNEKLANQWIHMAFDIIERHKLTPSDVLYDAILVTQLRIELALNKAMNIDSIEQAIASVENKYKSPSYILIHEYQTQKLRYFFDDLTDSYFFNIEALKNGLTPTNRYLYRSDFIYLKKRSQDLCQQINNELFCSKIKRALTND